MHNNFGLGFLENGAQSVEITEVGFEEPVARMVSHRSQILQVSGIGKFIDVNDFPAGVLERLADKAGTDKTGPAGDKNLHQVSIVAAWTALKQSNYTNTLTFYISWLNM